MVRQHLVKFIYNVRFIQRLGAEDRYEKTILMALTLMDKSSNVVAVIPFSLE